MQTIGIACFQTTLGLCGVAWSARGLTAVQLPEADETGTRSRLQSRSDGAPEAPPPPAVQQAIDAIVALLRGDKPDLGFITLDLEDTPAFERRAYAAARAVPPGQTTTYGAIAASLGEPGAARAVGQAMGSQSVSDRRAVSSRARHERRPRRVLGRWRRRDQAAHARHRGRGCRATRQPLRSVLNARPLGLTRATFVAAR